MFVDGKEGSPETEHPWLALVQSGATLKSTMMIIFLGEVPGLPPSDGFHWLAEQLGELDPELLMNVSYEDEMPNFVGWAVFDGPDFGTRALQKMMRSEILSASILPTPTLMTKMNTTKPFGNLFMIGSEKTLIG